MQITVLREFVMNFTNPILFFIVTFQVSIEIKFSIRNPRAGLGRLSQSSSAWIPFQIFQLTF